MGHSETTTTNGTQGPVYGVLAEFNTPGELVKAARRVKEAGYTRFDCYSPFPVHGIDEAMGIRRTILPLLVFGGGLTGLFLGLLLQWYLNAWNWKWNIGGTPTWSLPANIPIGFETTILLSVFTTFFGMWTLNRLPQVWHPFFRLDRFVKVTDDAFFLGVEAADNKFDASGTSQLLRDAGAVAVETCHLDDSPKAKRMPGWIFGVIATTTVLALIPVALLIKARASKSTEPHIHVFADMDFQPRVKSDGEFSLFGDERGNRGAVAGTVARGGVNTSGNSELDRGIVFVPASETDPTLVPKWTTELPSLAKAKLGPSFMARGKERYEIYCQPCHGLDGLGVGAVPQRVASRGGAWPARNLVEKGGVAIAMPNGQLFNVISNGANTMAGYASQIGVMDRWAIVMYVRALQRGQNASSTDAPELFGAGQ